MKKILIAIIVVSLLGVGGYLVYRGMNGSVASPEVETVFEDIGNEIGDLEYREAEQVLEKFEENEVPSCEDGELIMGEDIEYLDIFKEEYAIEGSIVALCTQITEEEAVVKVIVTDEDGNESIEEIIVFDPQEAFDKAHNAKREADTNVLKISMKMKDLDEGPLGADVQGEIVPTCSDKIEVGTGDGAYLPQIVPSYLVKIPYDSQYGSEEYTGYYVCVDDEGEYQVSSPALE